MTSPAFNGLVRTSKPGWDDIPDGDAPFYVGFRDGLFLHRRSLLGRGVVRVEAWPKSFPEFGSKNGDFDFEADPVPARLMGQVVNFFERIYDRQHTEAAVLLVMNEETKEWRIFVPTQMLSHGGVNYVFDPMHIRPPWVLVGSIHSHCDFGAGHSGTDTGDADGFDGLHCTIGHIKRDVPEIVAMMSMNKKYMHYAAVDFPLIFDFSEAKDHAAPEWWDRYCEDTVNKRKPVGFGLFEKYGKDTKVKNENKTVIKPAPHRVIPKDWVWSNSAQQMVPPTDPRGLGFEKRQLAKGQHGVTVIQHSTQRPVEDDYTEFYRLHGMEGAPDGYETYSPRELIMSGYDFSDEDKTWHWSAQRAAVGTALSESKEFNAKKIAERGVNWNDEEGLKDIRHWDDDDDEGMAEWMALNGWENDGYWETMIDQNVSEALFETDLMSEDDLDYAIKYPTIASDTVFWQEVIMNKVIRGITFLQKTGLEINLETQSPIKLKAEQHIQKGVH